MEMRKQEATGLPRKEAIISVIWNCLQFILGLDLLLTRNCDILLRIDNTTAISYINRIGVVQYPHLNQVAKMIWSWCEDGQIFVFAPFIRSALNVEADSEEWKWGYKDYTSWKRDPFVHNIDAFTINGSQFSFYAFPPFALIKNIKQSRYR